MTPERGYEGADLQAFAPELSVDALREAMHELWLAREVERFGVGGWRRVRSRRPHDGTQASGDGDSLQIGSVRPEHLFDHDSFAGWFK